ncbi:MAG: response regulator [Spirochaetota bacterium]
MLPKVLIVDKEPVDLEHTKKVLQELEYEFDIANDGESALQMLQDRLYQVVIVDADLEGMNTQDFVERSNRLFGVVCLVMSDDSDPERIIALLGKYAAFDYILKPLEKAIVKSSLDAAAARYEYNQKIASFNESEKAFYTRMMEIFDWRRELQSNQVESLTGTMIRQMNKNLFEDSAFAMLFSTLNMFFSKAKFNTKKNSYEITKNLYQLIQDNFVLANKMVKTIAESQKILTRTEAFTEVGDISEFSMILSECNKELRSMAAIKSQQLFLGRLPETTRGQKIIMDRDSIKSVLKELVTNAMKYSLAKDVIIVLFFINNEHLEVKVLNPARSNKEGMSGIYEKDERMVFEPFFRLSVSVDDRYKDEEFGYGLGLTVVKKIVELHNASILVHTIQNNVNETSESEVVFTISFPLVE